MSHSQQFVSKEVHDIGAIRLRLSAIDEQIEAQRLALASVSVDEVLADSDSGDAIVAKLAGLRARRDVLLAAETAALTAEEQRLADLREREAASARRAAQQHIGKMTRAARECSQHIEALQKSFDTMASAADSASILLPLPVRFKVADLLAEHHLRELTKAEAHRHAREGVHQFIRSQKHRQRGLSKISPPAPCRHSKRQLVRSPRRLNASCRHRHQRRSRCRNTRVTLRCRRRGRSARSLTLAFPKPARPNRPPPPSQSTRQEASMVGARCARPIPHMGEPTVPRPRQSPSDRHARELRRRIMERSDALPVLLDPPEVCAALGLTERQLRRRVSDGRLEDMVMCGDRSLFRAAQVRDTLQTQGKKPQPKSTSCRPPRSLGAARRGGKATPGTPVALHTVTREIEHV